MRNISLVTGFIIDTLFEGVKIIGDEQGYYIIININYYETLFN